jgi:DNA-binding HxlR family transcriptional regulator
MKIDNSRLILKDDFARETFCPPVEMYVTLFSDHPLDYGHPETFSGRLACSRAATLGPVQGRASCLILRDFFLHGPRRFQQLQDSLEGIAPNTLSERLRTLEENGVLERRFYSMSPPRAEYVLTAKGRDLGPIVRAMRDWGRKYAR